MAVIVDFDPFEEEEEVDPLLADTYVGLRDRVFLDGVAFTLEDEPPTAE